MTPPKQTNAAEKKQTRKPARTAKTPEHLSRRACRNYAAGVDIMEQITLYHIELLFNNGMNAKVIEIERHAHNLRMAQVNAHFFSIIVNAIRDESRVPSETELAEYAEMLRVKYGFTPEEWPWKQHLKTELYRSPEFSQLRAFFPLE